MDGGGCVVKLRFYVGVKNELYDGFSHMDMRTVDALVLTFLWMRGCGWLWMPINVVEVAPFSGGEYVDVMDEDDECKILLWLDGGGCLLT
ncbi:hypothetical protein Bca4012_055541 [Brassica carinata]